jgi:hypothetical protein
VTGDSATVFPLGLRLFGMKYPHCDRLSMLVDAEGGSKELPPLRGSRHPSYGEISADEVVPV